MEHPEKQISSERLYEGKILALRRDIVELENGNSAVREVVEHSGGVGILALDDESNVLMVRQFRYGIGRGSLEIPAGKREYDEDPATCGIRELEEETGYVADEFLPFGFIDPTPAYCSEVIYLYHAKGLHPTKQRLDPDEFLSIERIPFEEAVRLCLNGGITDAKTVVAVLKLYAMENASSLQGQPGQL